MFKHSVRRGQIGPPLAGIGALVVASPLALVGDRLVSAAAAAVVLALAIAAGVAGSRRRPESPAAFLHPS